MIDNQEICWVCLGLKPEAQLAPQGLIDIRGRSWRSGRRSVGHEVELEIEQPDNPVSSATRLPRCGGPDRSHLKRGLGLSQRGRCEGRHGQKVEKAILSFDLIAA